jgi:hypothetical protein
MEDQKFWELVETVRSHLPDAFVQEACGSYLDDTVPGPGDETVAERGFRARTDLATWELALARAVGASDGVVGSYEDSAIDEGMVDCVVGEWEDRLAARVVCKTCGSVGPETCSH